MDPKLHGDIIDLQEQHFVVYSVPRRRKGTYQDPDCPSVGPESELWGTYAKGPVHPAPPGVTGPCPSDIRGRCAYAVNEKGEVHYTKMEHKAYFWPYWHVTDYRAAYFDDGSTDTVFNNPLADGQKGFDGNVWYKLKSDKK